MADTKKGFYDYITGERIPDFTLQTDDQGKPITLGKGGMGKVYLAKQDPPVDRLVAIKVLREDLLGRPDAADIVKRFQQEARLLSRINHQNVIQVYKFGQTEPGGVLFLATEYLQGGKDLADTLREDFHKLDFPERLRRTVSVMDQTLAALIAAHREGVVHRDLKPENIYLLPGEEEGDHLVKLLDFGIAKPLEPVATTNGDGQPKLTQEGTVLGTPEYMSPEQLRGAEVDEKTDIYAAGIILYEMLVGRNPFAFPTMADSISAQIRLIPEPLEAVLPEETRPLIRGLAMVTKTALCKAPAGRYASAKVMRDTLRAAIAGLNLNLRHISQLPLPPTPGISGPLVSAAAEDARVPPPREPRLIPKGGGARPAIPPEEGDVTPTRHISEEVAAKAALGRAKTVTPIDLAKEAAAARRRKIPSAASRYLAALLVFVAALGLSAVILPPSSNSQEVDADGTEATRETAAEARPADAAAEATHEAAVKRDVVVIRVPVFVPTPPSRDAEADASEDATDAPEADADAKATEAEATSPPTPQASPDASLDGPPAGYEEHLAQGEEAMRTRNWKQAADEFKTATELWPEGATAWRELGNALLSLFKRDEGEAAIRRYLELAPNAADAPYFRSLIGEEQ
jgi:serine/threonine-protein kinase